MDIKQIIKCILRSKTNNLLNDDIYEALTDEITEACITKNKKPFAEVKFDKEQLKEIVDKAKAEVLASIERPQGEWNKCFDKNDYFIGYKCSKCENICKGIFNFCPNCGAEMRREADK